MNQEFIEQQIKSTKSDLVFHELQHKLAVTTLQGLELLPKRDNEELISETKDSVRWYNRRIEHDLNMLDVLYSARDLTNTAK